MRTYLSKEFSEYADTFDPTRSKLRLMPKSKVNNFMIGKTPDFYFLKAAKQSQNNELTHAIETLNKGLELKSNHLLCRFNHGVLMYKLGLMIQAKNDFQMLSCLYKKEFAAHYNYGLTLFQLGLYEKAIAALSLIVNQSKDALNSFQKLLGEKQGIQQTYDSLGGEKKQTVGERLK